MVFNDNFYLYNILNEIMCCWVKRPMKNLYLHKFCE